jgi:KDZ transposase family protein
MSLSSKSTKVKRKGTVREHKLVQSINHNGSDTIEVEELKTPKHMSQKLMPSNQQNQTSPTKRPKMDPFNSGPIPFNLEDPDNYRKRQTLVLLSLLWFTTIVYIYKGQNDYLGQFIQHENSYMNHLLNMEMPPTILTCNTCGCSDAGFRCLDCFGSNWLCQPCLIKCHGQHPFHRPQHWKDGSFENVSLCDLGFILILGHSSSGCYCPDGDNLFGDRKMTLIHTNGIFKHCIRFCRCQGASSEHEQLFGHQLFPSTFDQPETAFTLDVLDYYGIDAMECKTSGQSFFQKLRRVTNNAFPDDVPVSSSFFVNQVAN